MKSVLRLTMAMLLILGVCQLPARAQSKPLLIDVRTEAEWNEGHLRGAIRIPHEKIGDEIGRIAPDRKTRINLYCRTGRRSGIALDTLRKLGYENATNDGGIGEAAEKLQIPVVK